MDVIIDTLKRTLLPTPGHSDSEVPASCHPHIINEYISYIGAIVVVIGIIGATAITYAGGIRFHCANFVLNTYLYFILAMLGLGVVMLHLHVKYKCAAYDGSDEPHTIDNLEAIIMAAIGLFLIMAVVFLPRTYFWTHHLLFALLVIAAGYALFPLFDMYEHETRKALYVIIASMLLMAILHSVYPNLPYDKSWTVVISGVVVGGVLSEIIDQLTAYLHHRPEHTSIERGVHILLTIAVLILTYLDSKRIALHANACLGTTPNYIKESLHYVTDFFKLAVSV